VRRRIRYNPEDFPKPIGTKEVAMSVARVTEITAASATSFSDAVQVGIARANKTLKNVQGAWVQDQKVIVKGGKIVEYRVNMKVTFVLEA
jgi:flavin-binding protein dodecin